MNTFLAGFICSSICYILFYMLNTKHIIKIAYWQGEKAGFEAGVKKMERKYANNKKTNFKSKSL